MHYNITTHVPFPPGDKVFTISLPLSPAEVLGGLKATQTHNST